MNLIEFNEWIQGDDVIKTGNDSYLEQTTGFNKVFTKLELFNFFIREYCN